MIINIWKKEQMKQLEKKEFFYFQKLLRSKMKNFKLNWKYPLLFKLTNGVKIYTIENDT